jgi:hypothetical protein
MSGEQTRNCGSGLAPLIRARTVDIENGTSLWGTDRLQIKDQERNNEISVLRGCYGSISIGPPSAVDYFIEIEGSGNQRKLAAKFSENNLA